MTSASDLRTQPSHPTSTDDLLARSSRKTSAHDLRIQPPHPTSTHIVVLPTALQPQLVSHGLAAVDVDVELDLCEDGDETAGVSASDGEYVVSFGEMLYRSWDAVLRVRQQELDVGLINKPSLNVVDEQTLRKIGASPFVLVVESFNPKTGPLRTSTAGLALAQHPRPTSAPDALPSLNIHARPLHPISMDDIHTHSLRPPAAGLVLTQHPCPTSAPDLCTRSPRTTSTHIHCAHPPQASPSHNIHARPLHPISTDDIHTHPLRPPAAGLVLTQHPCPTSAPDLCTRSPRTTSTHIHCTHPPQASPSLNIHARPSHPTSAPDLHGRPPRTSTAPTRHRPRPRPRSTSMPDLCTRPLHLISSPDSQPLQPTSMDNLLVRSPCMTSACMTSACTTSVRTTSAHDLHTQPPRTSTAPIP
ncbi:hypothetical protein DFH08DRAFT_1018652 [Mycena albidolilacea]|uniref:Uncharacterized protein n=1 Tax=Mycena albidolilacea TaxID=1033008 RepID=A0AAD6ZS10_9AGAR|nr:hypothetical protein DFH08DRAFT_1018652 [Mycena albidolilacea]